MNNEIIHIFYACDDSFIKFTAVSLTSMKLNASKERIYHVHVLHTNVKESTQRLLLDMSEDFFTVTFDDVSGYLDGLCERLPLRDYYSNTTYYRMFIAEMFPKIDKAVYIDSDTVVQGDISELYDRDITEYDLGACHEQAMVQVDVYGSYVEKCLGIDRNAYFNAGVLLINCDRFRRYGILENFVRLLGIYDFRVTQDEDYLNVLCRDHVLWLPQSFNTEVFGEIPYPIEEAKIIHYIMVAKPWHFADCRFGDIFWHYAKRTAAYDEIRTAFNSYTDAQRSNDMESADRLCQLAVDEVARPDTFVARIAARRDPERVRILEKIALYEKEGRFDEDVEDDPIGREIRPGEVDYLGKKLSSRIRYKVAYLMAKRFLHGIIEERRLIVRNIVGIENFSALESGAVVTCNHFNAFDSFAMQMVYEASGHKKHKLYRVIREGNYTAFPGFFGYLMRNFHTLPLAKDSKAMCEFTRATQTLLAEGNFILVYPEQSMWWNYRKPKPLKPGGFYIAAKNAVPILPCFITMKDSRVTGEDGFPVQEYTVHVAPPIYPDPNKTVRENLAKMASENFRIWKEIYELEYGMPLRYSTEAREECR